MLLAKPMGWQSITCADTVGKGGHISAFKPEEVAPSQQVSGETLA